MREMSFDFRFVLLRNPKLLNTEDLFLGVVLEKAERRIPSGPIDPVL